MERNGANSSPDSKFVPTAEMMEDIVAVLQASFRNLMEGKDIEEYFELRETDFLAFGVGIRELFLANFERIKMGAIQMMEFADEKYLYSVPDAEDEVHRSIEATRKKLRIVTVKLETITANDRSEALGESGQRSDTPPDHNRSSTSSDSKSPDLDGMVLEVLQDLETGLLNSSRLTSQEKGTHELREDIRRAVRDSIDCMGANRKVEETCKLRETDPLAFKAGIIIHFIMNMITIETEVLKLEELCSKKEVSHALPFADDELHRDMDSARKGLEKIVELLSYLKNLNKAQALPAKPLTSDEEALR